MGLRRKGSRVIVVDGEQFRWVIAPDDEPGLAVVVEWADGHGQRMVTWVEHGTIITPGLVAQIIHKALEHGGTPQERAKQVTFRMQDARADQIPGSLEAVGRGWHPLLLDLHRQLLEVDPEYGVTEVKEKFGRLRVYLRAGLLRDLERDQAQRLVSAAEVHSGSICESCGNPGLTRHGDVWIKTVCDTCCRPRPRPGQKGPTVPVGDKFAEEWIPSPEILTQARRRCVRRRLSAHGACSRRKGVPYPRSRRGRHRRRPPWPGCPWTGEQT